MSDAARLEQLGLEARPSDGGLEAALELQALPLLNPITRRFVNRVEFTVVGDRLIPIGPPEVVGLPPIPLQGLERASDLESALAHAFNEHVLHVQRRSAELQTLGLEPRVDPGTLVLSTLLVEGGLQLTLVADKRGNFRVAGAVRDGKPLSVSDAQAFELSEFRERRALAGYLLALYGEQVPQAASRPEPTPAGEAVVRFHELARLFGGAALLPPRSMLELLVELRVGGESYRFAAARVAGRGFRGLLAGAKGKLWAERFDLDAFPGVVPLVAQVLNVPAESIEVVGPAGPEES